jgi:ABC-type uncharacterized transport system permease subunit
VSQITIFFLYLLAAVAFGLSRMPRTADRATVFVALAYVFALIGLGLHCNALYVVIGRADSLDLSIASALSVISLQLALIGLIGALIPALRGMAAGLLALAALASVPLGANPEAVTGTVLTWQIRAHVLISLFAYGLLTVGAIVAVFALQQDRRLRTGKFASGNTLFAPLETTEKMLFGVTAAGFATLLLAVVSGFAFVEDLFAQHLVHKTALSLLALFLFGVLLGGRLFAGWRGTRAVYLYLWGFAILGLAYFGSRVVLEELLNRSWG